jgi:hypothetical protein
MKSTVALAALFASVTGTAANAEPKAPPPPATELTAPAQAVKPGPRYCLKMEIPGSMILRHECRTVTQWKARDVDVLALAKR